MNTIDHPGQVDRWLTKDNLILLLGAFLALFVLYTSGTSPLSPLLQRTIIALPVLYIAILSSPAKNVKFRFLDWLLAFMSTVSVGYLTLNWRSLAYRQSYAPIGYEVLFGLCLIVVILVLTKRIVGYPLAIIALCALLYARFGNYLPMMFAHRGYSIDRLISNQYLTFEGVFGTMAGTLCTVIAPFVLFGSVLQAVGVGNLIVDAAYLVSKKSRGGPAKMAVIASGLFGMVSGSSTSNVMTTGCTTIPLMKKTGYGKDFAGAVEAAASTGGQIMPPVMGVAAFLMSYITGIPYVQIAIAALIPASFYFISIFIEVDLEARRINLRPLGDGEVQASVFNVLKRIYLFLPFVLLVYLLMLMWSPAKSAFWAIVLSLALACFRKETRISVFVLRNIVKDFASGMKTVAMACLTAGLVIGALNLTGATLRMTFAFVEVSSGNLLALMFCVTLLCIILGMGLPTPAAYSVAASFAAPALVQVGIPQMAAHLFVLYYASLSSITPPVALAAYAGASLSGGNPMRTGWIAWKLALVGFIVPFMFVFSPALLIGQAPALQTILAVCSGLVGVFFMAIATIGFFKREAGVLERLSFVAASVLLIHYGIVTDIIGITIGGIVLTIHILRAKRETRAVMATSFPEAQAIVIKKEC